MFLLLARYCIQLTLCTKMTLRETIICFLLITALFPWYALNVRLVLRAELNLMSVKKHVDGQINLGLFKSGFADCLS